MAVWLTSGVGPSATPPDVEDVVAMIGHLQGMRDDRGGIERMRVVERVRERVGHLGLFETQGSYFDAVHDRLGIAVRCEAGRAHTNNDGLLAVLEGAADPDVRRLVLVVPEQYKGSATQAPLLRRLRWLFRADGIQLSLEGVAVVGY